MTENHISLSDQNGKYVWLGLVADATAEDLAFFAAHPRQLERLRRTVGGDFAGQAVPSGTTHVMPYVGYEGYFFRVALRRTG